MIEKEPAPKLPSKFQTKIRPPYFFYILVLIAIACGYIFYAYKTEILAYFNRGSLVEIDENGNPINIDGVEKEPVTLAEDRSIYFYLTSKNRLEYGYNKPKEGLTIISSYKCRYNECEVFSKEGNETLYPMKDGNDYFLYNHETGEQVSPISPYKLTMRIYDKDTKELVGYLIKHKYKYGFFTDKVTVKPIYENIENVKLVLENKDMLDVDDKFNTNIINNTMLFLNSNNSGVTIEVTTGRVLFSNVSSIIKNDAGKLYYLVKGLDSKTRSTVYYLNDANGKEEYLGKSGYDRVFVRTDEDVIVTKNNQFQTENIYGKVKYTSKAYSNIYDVFENFVIVSEENKISIVNSDGTLISELGTIAEKENYVNYEVYNKIYSGIHEGEIWLYFSKCTEEESYLYKFVYNIENNKTSIVKEKFNIQKCQN